MARRGLGVVASLVACALVGALVGAVVPALTADAAISTPEATRKATAGRMAVPALFSADGIRALLPSGNVAYHLPALPDGGVRVLGDWNGDGATTPGIFDDGRWQLWNQQQRVNSPTATTTFGQPGDVPITGDWNGDGRTDLGVVRGSEWILTLSPVPHDGSAPVVYRDLTFGDGSGTPVSGDWDGDGVDGIGIFDNGIWTLADSIDAPTTTRTASYGAPGDVPVVGDWDGDGVDGIGVVRDAAWYLSNSLDAPRSALRATFAPQPGEIPVAWPVPDAAGEATCPTSRATRTGHPDQVVPSTLLGSDVRTTVGRTGRRVRGSLEESERYLLGAQYDALWRATRTRPYLDLLDRPGSDEIQVRLPAMSALAVAIGLTTGAYDRSVIGEKRPAGVRYVAQLVRSIACAHISVSPGGWGRGWETPHWAMLTGAAAWLLWDRLDLQTQTDVASMVADEADELATEEVPYWGLPDGTIVTPGDTKAEEDAWDSSLLALAATMMPAAPDASLWRAESAELAVAAYSTQADDTSTVVVNGVPLDERLQGFNALPDATVINHQRVHPDYASNVQLLWTAADFDRLARQRVPEAMFHNAGLVYSAFSTVSYQAGAASPAGGTYVSPGGTVYQPGHSWIYYPQGDDWGTARRAHFVSLDAHAQVYAPYLGATGWPAAQALAWHETGQQALVASSGADDGRTYSADPTVAAQQDTYPGREEYAAQNLATAWLALYVGQIGLPRLDRSTLAVPVTTTKAPSAPKTTRLAP